MSINTDPRSLYDVASAIDTANKEIDTAIKKMQSVLSGAHWNDPVRKKFDQDFAALISGLDRFRLQAPQTIQYLKTKVQQLEQFTQ